MAVIRVNKTKDFTVMSNAHFKERGMSLKAKGLLSLMLSLPDEWDYSIGGLATLSKDGDKGTRKALVELEAFGYVKRTLAKDQNGLFAGYDYDIFENPQDAPLAEKRSTEKRSTEKPSTVKRSTEKGTQLNTNTLTTNQLKTDVLSTDVVKGGEPPDYDNDDDKLVPFKGLMLSENQMCDLLDKMGLEAFDEYVFRLQAFIENTGANVKSHYATILKWYNEDRGIA